MKHILEYFEFIGESTRFGDPFEAVSEDGYLYHLTYPDNIDSIAREGLIPQEPNEDLQAWQDFSTEPRIYFGSDLEALVNEYGSEDYPLLRIRAEDVEVEKDRHSFVGDESFSITPISPDLIEIWTAQKSWVSITQYR